MSRLSMLGVGARIAAFAGFLTVLLAIVGFVAARGLEATADRGHEVYTRGAVALDDLRDAEKIYVDGRVRLTDLLIETDRTKRAQMAQRLATGAKEWTVVTKRLQGEVRTPGAVKLWKTASSSSATSPVRSARSPGRPTSRRPTPITRSATCCSRW